MYVIVVDVLYFCFCIFPPLYLFLFLSFSRTHTLLVLLCTVSMGWCVVADGGDCVLVIIVVACVLVTVVVVDILSFTQNYTHKCKTFAPLNQTEEEENSNNSIGQFSPLGFSVQF